jgi:putative flippase GtrA
MTENFDFIYVHRNPNYDFRAVFAALEHHGGVCRAFFQRTGYELNQPLPSGIPLINFERGRFQLQLGAVLRQIKSAENGGSCPVIVVRDDPEFTLAEVEEILAAHAHEKDAIWFFEKIDTVTAARMSVLDRGISKIRTKIQGPDISIWVIPPPALACLNEGRSQQNFFLFSWLSKCRRSHVPIHLIRREAAAGKIWESNALSSFHLFIYTLNMFLRYSASSILSFLVDNGVFYLLDRLGQSNLTSLIGGRVVSLLVNFLLLKTIVFKTNERSLTAFLKYIGLVIFSGSIVWAVITFGETTLGIEPILVKLLIEGVMFFFNYYVSKSLIFK